MKLKLTARETVRSRLRKEKTFLNFDQKQGERSPKLSNWLDILLVSERRETTDSLSMIKD